MAVVRNRKVVIAPDSFKGSLSAAEVAAAIERGVRRAAPDASTVCVPMADGGEGTVEALVAALGGSLRTIRATGPLGEAVEAPYGVLPGGTAVIEMAAASGLPLVPADQRNPWLATTRGTGELIRAALDAGCRRILIGIGGSATNDGGMGMLAELGIRFIAADGSEVGNGGQDLHRVAAIDRDQLDPRLADAEIIVMCDVDNPLCGEHGAAAVYGPQKGADPGMVKRLDEGLAHYAAIIEQLVGMPVRDLPGAGAAGGLGAGLVALLNGSLRSGIATVLEATGLENQLAGAALAFTGEGRTDHQTAHGKVAAGVGEAAKRQGVPLICLSGGLGDGIDQLYGCGITALFSIANGPMALEDAMQHTAELLEQAAENIARLHFWQAD